jgi:peptidoglycan/LPS O-acetylase OafA/YrhL
MSNITPIIKRPQLPALTGVRFLAAFAIVAHHFSNPKNTFAKAAVDHGLIGVSLFFILSGFILAYTYYAGPGSIKGTHRQFWFARFARIYPMYVIGMIAMAPLILAWGDKTQIAYSGLAGITLVQAWLPFSMRGWNPPGWSLSAEAFFYVLFPFAIKEISTLRRRSMIALLLLCWLASLIAPAIYVHEGAIDRDFWMFNPLVRLPEFLIGVIAGVLWMERDQTPFTLPTYTVELAGGALIAILCIPMNEAYVMNGTWAPLTTLVIVGLADGRGPVARLLGKTFFVTLGGASFSLYIMHWPLWYEAKAVASRLHLDANSHVGFWAITLGILIPASYVCFRFIEEPANRFLRARLPRLHAPSRQAQPVSPAHPVPPALDDVR